MAWFRNRSRSPSGDAPTLAFEERIALAVLEGSDTGTSLAVSSHALEIGRGDETAAIDGRIGLRDRSVSILQARLARGAGGWLLEHNPEATNPTLVNGEAIQRKRIAAGDRIRMGRILLEVRAGASSEIAERRPGAREEHTEMIRMDAVATTQLRPGGLWGHLAVVRGPGKLTGMRFPLTGESVTLGRAQDCDLVLLDPGVSRRHAELLREGDRVVLLAPRRTRRCTTARPRDRAPCSQTATRSASRTP